MIEPSALLLDEDVVHRVRSGDSATFELIMRRYNSRLYRIARSIVGDDDEAEDVVQESYVRAWSKLAQFEGRSSFATWLTRIAVHEALARARRHGREHGFDHGVDCEDEGALMGTGDEVRDSAPGPDEVAASKELRRLLDAAVDELPEGYRLVLVLRDIEGLTGAEAAAALDTTEGNVKVRLHRARGALRRLLEARAARALKSVYEFHAVRCDRVVARVLERILSMH